jgi:8-oxo-dGTP pyrophosphatase MutT (NUDIX family)
MDYACQPFGDLMVPYFEIHENVKRPYSSEDVIISPKFLKSEDPTMTGEKAFEIPDLKVRNLEKEIAQARKEEAEKKGKVWFNGPMVRLENYSLNDDEHLLYLTLGRTNYATFSATNRSVDNPEVKRMLEERGSSYTNLNDGLADPIGVGVIIHSIPDDVIVITKRSEKLDQYPGLRGLPAGWLNPDTDRRCFREHDSLIDIMELGPLEKFVYNPFETARREVEEEVGVKSENINMIGFGRAGDDRHLEFLMTAETSYTAEKILSSPKVSKWESQKIELVPFEPKEVMKYLTETIEEEPKGVPKGTGVWVPGKSPKWVAAAWHGVNSALINEFGFDKVWKAYEETRQKH